MTWLTLFFILYLIELGICSYIVYLHFEIKRLEKIRVSRPKYQKQVVVKTKKDIVRG
jgi:hypothetical protein